MESNNLMIFLVVAVPVAIIGSIYAMNKSPAPPKPPIYFKSDNDPVAMRQLEMLKEEEAEGKFYGGSRRKRRHGKKSRSKRGRRCK
jgi:hypothetical protein